MTSSGVIRHDVNGVFGIVSGPGGTVASIAVANSSDVWVASSTGGFRYLASTKSWEQHCPEVAGCGVGFGTVVASNGGMSTTDVWFTTGTGGAGAPYYLDQTALSATNSLVGVTASLRSIATGGVGDVWGVATSGTLVQFQAAYAALGQ